MNKFWWISGKRISAMLLAFIALLSTIVLYFQVKLALLLIFGIGWFLFQLYVFGIEWSQYRKKKKELKKRDLIRMKSYQLLSVQ